jgi:LPXTG-site transpeptidase (sortase) family protein
MVIALLGLSVPFLSFGLSRDEGVVLQSMPLEAASGSAPAVVKAPILDRLVIAQQGIDMPLVNWKNGEAALWTGAWLWPNGARPGQTGNMVVFGHRFRYLPPLSNTLFKLDRVAVGDIITVHWKNADYRYRVIGSSVIEPDNLSVLAPSSKKLLTIITCTPVFSTSHRLVVIAQLLD